MNTDIRLFAEEEMKAMGKRIQNARKKKGFKSIDFADIIGIGKDQLSRIENGKVLCKIEHIYVISQVLEVSCDYLLFGKIEDNQTVFIIQMISNMSLELKNKAIKILEVLSI